MKIYLYHHCPYCIKVRLIADLSNLNYKMIILANDDEKAHISRIGCKQVPFLEKDNCTFIKESNDICKYIAKIQNFNIQESSINSKLKDIIKNLNQHQKIVTYPRIPHHPDNKYDFPNQTAKEYFISKKSKLLGDINYLLKNPDFKVINNINKALKEINMHIKTPFFNGDIFSWDDINIFPIFFMLTVARDLLKIPKNIEKYIQSIQSKTNINLYNKLC